MVSNQPGTWQPKGATLMAGLPPSNRASQSPPERPAVAVTGASCSRSSATRDRHRLQPAVLRPVRPGRGLARVRWHRPIRLQSPALLRQVRRHFPNRLRVRPIGPLCRLIDRRIAGLGFVAWAPLRWGRSGPHGGGPGEACRAVFVSRACGPWLFAWLWPASSSMAVSLATSGKCITRDLRNSMIGRRAAPGNGSSSQ
jgi:hypothetical protein